MSSERTYNRGYLTPDGYYKQALAHMQNQDGYTDGEDKSELGKTIGTVAGLALGVGSAKVLYDQGKFRSFIQQFAKGFANNEALLTFNNMLDSVKEITSNPKGNTITDIIDIVHNNTVKNAIEKTKMQSALKQQQLLENLEVINFMKQKQKVLHELRSQNLDAKVMMTIENNLGRDLIRRTALDMAQEADMFTKTGLRHATLSDLVHMNKLDDTSLMLVNQMKKEMPDIMKSMADRGLIINEAGELIDFRDSVEAFKKMGRSAINDYAIPVLGINPMKMFYLEDLMGISELEAPMFHHVKPHYKDPLLVKHNQEVGASYIISGDVAYDTVTGRQIADGLTLKRANGGLHATEIGQIADIHSTGFELKNDGYFTKAGAKISSVFDIGLQDRSYPGKFDIQHPGTAFPYLSQKISDKVSPYNKTQVAPLRNLYNDNPWLTVPAAKKLGQTGAGAQLVAGRKNLSQVTEATIVPYMLTERMNRSLQPFGIALSNKSLGSTGDVFTGLFAKRVLPVVLALGTLKYVDYLLENKEGVSPKDVITDGIANADTNIAGFRDKIGLNERMEKFKEISPGMEFIAEMPIIGKLFDSKTEEETKEYWEEGYDAVRKGRYWTLGNTPYTGGRVEYFRPNLKRRVQSDYQYTDVKWGSKKEFWENNWLPTPTNPFSPVKHFVTDPYHWEKKHYKDRPYPITGGIAELREIPVIGGFLDATVGRVLKPQKRMHMEYWDGDHLKTDLTVEDVPYQSITRPAPGMSGVPGGTMLPDSKEGEYKELMYSTSSGMTNIYAAPTDVNAYEINRVLKEGSIKRVKGVTQVSKGGTEYGTIEKTQVKPFNPNGLMGAVEGAYTDATDLAGFYGFTFKSVFGGGEVNKTRLATSSDLYSYSDMFWDQSLGGFGGEISEIFRRFAPNKSFEMKKNEFNPIRNTMPTWLPGPEYYIDFLHGDPYEKVKEGEYRLPGAGYEAMHGLEDPMEFKIGSSSIGNDLEGLIKHYLQVDDIEIADNDSLKTILASGTATHEQVEAEWEKIGYAVATEYYVKDEENNIEGWIDAIVRDKSTPKGYAISDIKTISQKGYDKLLQTGEFKDGYKAQMNFYMHMMGLDKAYLHFMNREDKSADAVTVELNYDKEYMQSVYDKLELSRNILTSAIDQGVIQRGDLYKPIDRFRILADVAPYSENFRFYNSLMSKMDLKEEDKAEVEKIRERVSQVKEKMRITPYKFKTANLDTQTVTVRGITNDGFILTEEHAENPLRLAGLNFSSNEETEEGAAAMSFLKKNIKTGTKIQVGLNADPVKRVNDDTYSTMDAVIFPDDKKNLNKQMLEAGLAEEKENDDSATGINARFTKAEIRHGSIFESFSHRDLPFNTKFMQTRSALEQYERRDLYGKDWQSWTNPIEGFLKPTYENMIRKNPVVATSVGMLVGSMFGAPGNRYGKLIGGTIGGAIGLIGSTSRLAKEKITGEAYIPERRQKEREMNEYFDMLKYVKNRKLFDKFRDAAIEKEGVDPAEILAKNKRDGEYRKNEIYKLSNIKKDLYTDTISFQDAKKAARFEGNDRKELEDYLTKRITSLKNYRDAEAVTPLAAQAIMYYNESEKTAYGYDAGEPIQNMLSALNRKDRKYFSPFLEAPEEERDRILQIAPSYMKRALQSAYGRVVDPKKDITEYFQEHYLPGSDWAGWNPEVDLEDVKIKMVKHEGMDASEFDIWSDDEERAKHLQIPLPKLNYSERAGIVREKLRSVLMNAGLDEVMVDVSVTQEPGISVDMDIQKDRRKDIEEYINSYGIF